ncbi:MAG: hypothetical protein Q8928_08130 [Bacteroidota bacterium]|nr:hypothetical protein [Bacteroidota bacterium]
MNKDRLLSLIRHPQLMLPDDRQDLLGLVREFPFFQSAHFLLLYNLKKFYQEQFDEQLKESALYIADRRALFNFVHELSAEQLVTTPETTLQAPVTSEPAVIISEIEPKPLQEEPVITSVSNQPIDKSISEVEPEISAEPLEETPPVVEEKPIGSESIVEPPAQPETLGTVSPMEDEKPIAEEHVIEKEPEPKSSKPEFVPEYTYNSYNLESALADQKPKDAAQRIAEDLADITAEFELEFDDDFLSFEEPEEVVGPDPFALIDKFIDENPSFTPNRLDLTEHREDISAESVKENDGLATETLAMIYTSQKLYDKAIAVYEKLILKFPEKSTFFASRVEELRNHLK